MKVNAVKKFVADNEIDYFLCSFVEMASAPKAKLVPVTNLDEMATEGAGFAGSAAGEMGQGPHDPDMMNIPDFSSMMIVPWHKNVAWVAGNIHVEEEPWPYCPRTILQNQLAKANDLGYSFHVGVEAEFMLLKEVERGRFAPWDDLDRLDRPCYDLRALHRNLPLLTTLVDNLQELGWNPYALDHEDATCQFEINWTFSDALNTADRHTFFKWMVKTLAEQHELTATFMPRPFGNLTGNGAHYHMSLWDAKGKKNLFDDPKDEHGLSQTGYWFMGGILKHAKALAALGNPLVNSYKRLAGSPTLSGATYAPVAITHGGKNRTQMLRMPGGGRFENRSLDGAANPYLAMTGMLAAGLDGVTNKIDPGAINTDNLYEMSAAEMDKRGIERLPGTLKEAIDALAEDDVVKNALGVEYADYYIDVKRNEWQRYHSAISQWEIENYLEVY